MVNVSVVLKDMIRRLARREIKAQTSSTKQAVAQYRRDIATLKRLVGVQQKELAFLKAQERKRLNRPQPTDEPVEGVRFSARSARAQRQRLGLSAEDFGKLVGVSSMTIYNWEHGKSRPRNAQLARLVAARSVGKQEAVARLEASKTKRRQAVKTTRKLRRKKPR